MKKGHDTPLSSIVKKNEKPCRVTMICYKFTNLLGSDNANNAVAVSHAELSFTAGVRIFMLHTYIVQHSINLQ